MMNPPGRHDRLLGVVCFIGCPLISGVFLGVIGALCAYPAGRDHAIRIGIIVGACGFVANAVAIGLTAVAAEGRAQRRAARALTVSEVASAIRETASTPKSELPIRPPVVGPRAYEKLGRRS